MFKFIKLVRSKETTRPATKLVFNQWRSFKVPNVRGPRKACGGLSPPTLLLVEASRASRSFRLAVREATARGETYTCTSSRLTSNTHDDDDDEEDDDDDTAPSAQPAPAPMPEPEPEVVLSPAPPAPECPSTGVKRDAADVDVEGFTDCVVIPVLLRRDEGDAGGEHDVFGDPVTDIDTGTDETETEDAEGDIAAEAVDFNGEACKEDEEEWRRMPEPGDATVLEGRCSRGRRALSLLVLSGPPPVEPIPILLVTALVIPIPEAVPFVEPRPL